MAGVHLLMKVRLPFTGLLSERFYTVCLSVGVSDALRMMSHSRVDPAQKRPLLSECGQAELLAPPGRELAFSLGFFSLFSSYQLQLRVLSVEDLLGVPLSLDEM